MGARDMLFFWWSGAEGDLDLRCPRAVSPFWNFVSVEIHFSLKFQENWDIMMTESSRMDKIHVKGETLPEGGRKLPHNSKSYSFMFLNFISSQSVKAPCKDPALFFVYTPPLISP